MFELLEIPHPRTRVYYGKRQKKKIIDDFAFPFVAKIPRGSAMGRGVYLIQQNNELSDYLKITNTAYIQEFLPSDRDIRVVIIGEKIVHAYWRIAPENDFRCNIAVGGRVCLDSIPADALIWRCILLDHAVGMTWESTSVGTKVNSMYLKLI